MNQPKGRAWLLVPLLCFMATNALATYSLVENRAVQYFQQRIDNALRVFDSDTGNALEADIRFRRQYETLRKLQCHAALNRFRAWCGVAISLTLGGLSSVYILRKQERFVSRTMTVLANPDSSLSRPTKQTTDDASIDDPIAPDWYTVALTHFRDFRGRMRRREYWMFITVTTATGLATMALGQTRLVGAIWSLFIFIPWLSATVRRLHDAGHTGWWLGLWIVPAVGPLTILFLLFRAGEARDNRYGPDPMAHLS
jgi:uncharacterized membrane protein YhaH (DUF805 family)